MTPDSNKLALSFSKQWENFGNSSSPELIELWTIIFQTFNDSIERNVSGSELEYSVIPAVTGSGKTLCYRWYAAQLAREPQGGPDKRVGMLIVTTLTKEADETESAINDWAGDRVAVAYHSDSSIKTQYDEDCLNNFQIVVITHEYFKRHHHLKSLGSGTYQKVLSYNGKERELVVIDESIEMVNNICISQEDIQLADRNLSMLQRVGHAAISDECRLLQYLDQNYMSLFIDTSLLDDTKTFRHLSIKTDMIQNAAESLNLSINEIVSLFSFKHSIELVESGELLKSNRALHKDGVNDLLRAINDFRYLLDDNLYIYQDKKYRTSTMELPLKSVVILHATALVDKVCQIVPNVKVVHNLPVVKRYSNVTVEFVNTNHGLGKGLTDHPELNEQHIECLTSALEFYDDRQGVIFTHLALEKQLLTTLDGYHIDHFNNLNGVNSYKDCTDVLIYGHMYLPDYIYYDLQFHSQNNLKVGEREGMIPFYKYARIASDVVQMINRGVCRKIVDGEAPEMRVTILMPNNGRMVEAIETAIVIEMPGIQIKKSEQLLKFGSDNKERGLSTLDSLFLEMLNGCADGQRFANICKSADITKSGKETLMLHLKDPESALSKASPFELRKEGQYKLFKKT